MVLAFLLLSLAVFAISVSAKTTYLWKLGLLFLINWFFTIVITNSYIDSLGPLIVLNSICGILAILIFATYKSRSSLLVGLTYFVMIQIQASFLLSQTLTGITNSLQLTQALIIVYSSLKSIFTNQLNLDKNGWVA